MTDGANSERVCILRVFLRVHTLYPESSRWRRRRSSGFASSMTGTESVATERRKTCTSKKELNSEIWGKGVCDMWEKWVSGWRNKILQKRIKF